MATMYSASRPLMLLLELIPFTILCTTHEFVQMHSSVAARSQAFLQGSGIGAEAKLGRQNVSRARGVVVSHALSMREALGSIPNVSMCHFPWLATARHASIGPRKMYYSMFCLCRFAIGVDF